MTFIKNKENIILIVSVLTLATTIASFYFDHQYRKTEKIEKLLERRLSVFQKARDLFFKEKSSFKEIKIKLEKIKHKSKLLCGDNFLVSTEEKNYETYEDRGVCILQKLDEIKVLSKKYFSKSISDKFAKLGDLEWEKDRFSQLRCGILQEMEKETVLKGTFE